MPRSPSSVDFLHLSPGSGSANSSDERGVDPSPRAGTVGVALAEARFRYESNRWRHQGDWVDAGEERSFVHQCKRLGLLLGLAILAFWGYAQCFGNTDLTLPLCVGAMMLTVAWTAGAVMHHWVLCARVLTFAVWATVSSGAFVDGRFSSPILWLLPLAPMIAGHMLCTTVWMASSALSCTTVFGLYILEFNDPVQPDVLHDDVDLVVYRGLALMVYLAFALFTSISAQKEFSTLKAQEKELELARRASESAMIAKSRFLANMSHEIRTPMHGIVGTTAILKRLQLDPQEREAADTIYSCGEALLALLTNVLDYSKLEAGKLVAGSQDFEPSALVQRIAAQWRPRLERRGVSFDCEIVGEASFDVLGDSELLTKVVSYLLDNAVRYGHHAAIRLALSCELVQERACKLCLSVEDRGPGIAPEEMERLMTPFERGRGLDGDNIEGIGLGLALAASLTELMGGTLSLFSPEKGGLRAELSLSLPVCQERGETQPEPRRNAERDEPFKVLVVDDQPVNLTVARALLQTLGCEVHTANDGHEGVQRAESQRFDLILMDLEMPQLSGWEAARAISGGVGKNACTPILAMSAHDAQDTKVLRERGGMVGHLSKPFYQQQLVTILERTGWASERLVPDSQDEVA